MEHWWRKQQQNKKKEESVAELASQKAVAGKKVFFCAALSKTRSSQAATPEGRQVTISTFFSPNILPASSLSLVANMLYNYSTTYAPGPVRHRAAINTPYALFTCRPPCTCNSHCL